MFTAEKLENTDKQKEIKSHPQYLKITVINILISLLSVLFLCLDWIMLFALQYGFSLV